jgi:hypothetical protein
VVARADWGVKMKTKNLEGKALDWAVAKCEGVAVAYDRMNGWWETSDPQYAEPNDPEVFNPSTDWAQGGPIIEREGIALDQWRSSGRIESWVAQVIYPDKEIDGVAFAEVNGATPLIAAMRCYVASKLGDEVEIPKEIL